MLKELIKLSSLLDSMGRYKAAREVDHLIYCYSAQEGVEVDFYDDEPSYDQFDGDEYSGQSLHQYMIEKLPSPPDE